MSRVALIGAGIMGTAVATRLPECGYSVPVYDMATQLYTRTGEALASDVRQ